MVSFFTAGNCEIDTIFGATKIKISAILMMTGLYQKNFVQINLAIQTAI